MGLDISIRTIGPRKRNKQNLSYWTVVEIGSLRNTWKFLDNLDGACNCRQSYFTGEELYYAANDISDDCEKYDVLDELKRSGVVDSDENIYGIYPWW